MTIHIHGLRCLSASALALFVTTGAWAQSAPLPAHGAGPARHEALREHRAERHQRHLGALKARLQLQASQEGAWQTFAAAMQPPGPQAAQPERVALEKLSTPERIDQMQAWHAQRHTEMAQRAEATKAFYASLSAEQKKVFDAETARPMHGHGHRHMH